jgi:putative two-component system response regulator
MKSILIVDDNLVSLRQISALLSKDYDVSLAKSGELALQICAQEKPDLILLDVEMTGMDGFETIARLKEDERLKQIPVIFLTGNRDAETEVKCLESGAMDFITKPANAEILHHRIELHLEFSLYQLHLEHMVKELEDNIGISFAELLDCKDYNAAIHMLRTGEYVELLVKELFNEGTFRNELTADDADLIKRAAPFHDIGKLGISDIILLKRNPLTDMEIQEVRKHTIIGGEVLKAIYDRTPSQQYLKVAMVLAEGHHENFDGTGYPNGLAGESIPLFCRILSVINTYDALITDRVYRKGITHEEACQKILDGRGTRFDPRIVDVFEKIKDKIASLNVTTNLTFKDHGWSVYNETNTGS